MRRYSCEYVDEDGDVVIKNFSLSQQDAYELLGVLGQHGIRAKLYDITPVQVDEAAGVSSPDEQKPRLAPVPTGCVR